MNIAAEKAGIMDDKKWLYEDADLSYELEMEKDPAFQAGLLIGPDGEIQKPKKKKSAKGKDNAKASRKNWFSPASVSETTGLPIENRRMSYGFIKDPGSGEIVDEVLAVAMKAPYTYTRENIAEIYCHGSVAALRKTLSLILKCGARLAEPGEFTKRAFLNGRLDLSQAEALYNIYKSFCL